MKIKDSFIDEEPVGYDEFVFNKEEEAKLQKYVDEIDRIKKCFECGGRLFAAQSKRCGKCINCRKQDGVFGTSSVQYPKVESLSEMNSYLGL